jgi:hypothetical protein
MPPVRFPAVRNVFAPLVASQEEESGAGFSDPDAQRVQQCVSWAEQSAQAAAQLGARWIIVELGVLPRRLQDPEWSSVFPAGPLGLDLGEGEEALAGASLQWLQSAREQQNQLLDRICRALHAICVAEPSVRVALTPPARPYALPTLEMLEKILDDLGPRRISFWHDTGRGRVLSRYGVAEEEAWLARFGDRCVGVDLTDAVELCADLPAGSGEVDFVALRSAIASTTIACLKAQPFPGVAAMASARDFLLGAGF